MVLSCGQQSHLGFNAKIDLCLLIGILDRARWGASGALSSTIRYSGIEFPTEAGLCLDWVRKRGDEGMGPAQRSLCKSRQDRKVAAVAELYLVLQESLA